MKILAIVVYSALLGLVLAPAVAGAIAVYRASEQSIDAAIVLLSVGALLVLAGIGVAFALYGASHWRRAVLPPADVYHYDQRRQAVVYPTLPQRQATPELPAPYSGETATAYRARVQHEATP